MSGDLRLSHTSKYSAAAAPPSDVYVQVDTSEIEQRFEFLTEEMGKAARRAAARTRDWLSTQLSRELAARSGLPKKALKPRFRKAKKGGDKNSRHYSNEGFAVLWIGLNAVSAEKAGQARHVRRVRSGRYHKGPKPVPGAGVRVRKHFFDRAFTAEIYGGGEKVWRRKNPGPGSGQFPVVKMTIPISDAMEEILPKYQKAAERMFSDRLEHEINYLLEQRA
jgi:hypothetical protein